MYNIICVSNRRLCTEDLICRIERFAKTRQCGIILREKDLSQEEYSLIAKQAVAVCKKYSVPCILHSFVKTAIELNHKSIHLPMNILNELSEDELRFFDIIGASCHSAEEAVKAQRLGCTYTVAGNIFETACKNGLEGKGLDFLNQICRSVSIPVYAIGGIDRSNIGKIHSAGAFGVCVMSGPMKCEHPDEYINALRGGFV